jgi:hypothetical protein
MRDVKPLHVSESTLLTTISPVMANSSETILDKFVKNVRPDAKAADPILYLNGYVGESPVEGHYRIYTDQALNQFLDVPKNAIAHSVANTKEENSLGGSHLWIRQNDLAGKSASGGSFLEGDVYNQYARNVYQPSPMGTTYLFQHCGNNNTVNPCKYPTLGTCESVDVCQSQACQSQACQSRLCMTQACQSQACPTSYACETQDKCTPTIGSTCATHNVDCQRATLNLHYCSPDYTRYPCNQMSYNPYCR